MPPGVAVGVACPDDAGVDGCGVTGAPAATLVGVPDAAATTG